MKMLAMIFLSGFVFSAIASERGCHSSLPALLAVGRQVSERDAFGGIMSIFQNNGNDMRSVDGNRTAAGILLHDYGYKHVFSTPEGCYSFWLCFRSEEDLQKQSQSIFARIKRRALRDSASRLPCDQYAIEEVDDMKVPELKFVTATKSTDNK